MSSHDVKEVAPNNSPQPEVTITNEEVEEKLDQLADLAFDMWLEDTDTNNAKMKV